MTLAAIGRVLGEHEATVSRKLDKARRTLRAEVERALAAQGLAPAAITRAFELAADAPDLQLDRLLATGGRWLAASSRSRFVLQVGT